MYKTKTKFEQIQLRKRDEYNHSIIIPYEQIASFDATISPMTQ